MRPARCWFLRIDAHIVQDLSRLLFLGSMLTSPARFPSEFVILAWGPRLCLGIGGNDAHIALVAETLGLVVTPSVLPEVVWGGMDAHIVPG